MGHDHTAERQEPSTQAKLAFAVAGVAQAGLMVATVAGSEPVKRVARRVLTGQLVVAGSGVLWINNMAKRADQDVRESQADDDGLIDDVRVPTLGQAERLRITGMQERARVRDDCVSQIMRSLSPVVTKEEGQA